MGLPSGSSAKAAAATILLILAAFLVGGWSYSVESASALVHSGSPGNSRLVLPVAVEAMSALDRLAGHAPCSEDGGSSHQCCNAPCSASSPTFILSDNGVFVPRLLSGEMIVENSCRP